MKTICRYLFLAVTCIAAVSATAFAEPEYAARNAFWIAAEAVCDAGIALGRRYAELASSLAAAEGDAGRTRRHAEGRAQTLIFSRRRRRSQHIQPAGPFGRHRLA